MKSIKLLSLFIVGVLAFSSCKNNMSLTKRHYTKGYYFHKNKSVNQPEVKEGIASKISKQVEKNDKESPLEIVKVLPTQNVETTNNASSKQALTANSSKKATAEISNKQKTENGIKSLNQTKKELQQNSKQTKKTAAKGDANFVVMIILALFPILCLIAVYLHDGNVTKNFWIDLILHITVLGAMIYAVLVVLDIIDFA